MTQSPIQKAKEALRPFAEASEVFPDDCHDSIMISLNTEPGDVWCRDNWRPTLGDLRRAREALKALEGE